MSFNFLSLNLCKTEFLIFGLPQQLSNSMWSSLPSDLRHVAQSSSSALYSPVWSFDLSFSEKFKTNLFHNSFLHNLYLYGYLNTDISGIDQV